MRNLKVGRVVQLVQKSKLPLLGLSMLSLLVSAGCAVDKTNPPHVGNQYLDTGWLGPTVTIILSFFILFNIARAGRGRDLYIRRIAGLNAIDEAVGRATEMGRPVMMVPGLSDPVNAIAMQALNIFSYVSRIAARFANPILVCCYSGSVYTVAQEIIRDVYQQEGLGDRYDPDSVRFISDKQFAFAAGVSGLILREQTAATFFMGEWYAESLIFAETANSIGAIQVASSTEVTQTPFFIAACDYVLIGDEFYAASAYLTRQPVLTGSLVGQDWCKLMIMAMIFFGAVINGIQFRGGTITTEKIKGMNVPVQTADGKSERPMTEADTIVSQMLRPQTPEIDITDRPKDPNAKPAEGGGE
jgi:hypothetical protein